MKSPEGHSRFEPQIGFLKRRLSPEGWLGLHLTVGCFVFLAAAWVFGSLAEDVVHRDPIVKLDQTIAAWFQMHATPVTTQVMRTISFFGSGAWLFPVSVLGGVVLIRRRAWDELSLLVLVPGGGGVLNVLLKNAFHRARPVFEHPIQTLPTYSFPSGHTMSATLFYGLMAVFAVTYLRGWPARSLAVASTVTIILLVGLSRIALVVHFFSDVVAAMAAGVVWLALCVTAVSTHRRRRRFLADSAQDPEVIPPRQTV